MPHVAKAVWIVAGEPSGDRLGARLAQELRRRHGSLILRGMGGAAMRSAGVDLLVDSSDLAIVGLIEVVKHYRTIRRAFYELLTRARTERPDAVVLIDYPGFNLRLAKRLHRAGVPVVYYVCPQVWAWGKNRVPQMACVVDKLLAIFPFEPAVFAGTGLDVEFVGHPLPGILREGLDAEVERRDQTVLLLPGSREHEVNSLLPPMIEAARLLRRDRPELEFVIAAPAVKTADLVRERLAAMGVVVAAGGANGGGPPTPGDPGGAVTAGNSNGGGPPSPGGLLVRLVVGETQAWMRRACAGIAASGTVTLEAAILGLPLVVAYRVNPLTYWIARRMVRVAYITIVNLVAGSEVFEEFIQGRVTSRNLADSLGRILPGGSRRAAVVEGMSAAVAKLGDGSHVSERVAAAVLAVADRAGTEARQCE